MRWFTNLATRAKLMLGFGLIAAVFLLATSAAYLAVEALRAADVVMIDMLTIRNNANAQRAILLATALNGGGPEQENRFR